MEKILAKTRSNQLSSLSVASMSASSPAQFYAHIRGMDLGALLAEAAPLLRRVFRQYGKAAQMGLTPAQLAEIEALPVLPDTHPTLAWLELTSFLREYYVIPCLVVKEALVPVLEGILKHRTQDYANTPLTFRELRELLVIISQQAYGRPEFTTVFVSPNEKIQARAFKQMFI
jgi:hypothetical protein